MGSNTASVDKAMGESVRLVAGPRRLGGRAEAEVPGQQRGLLAAERTVVQRHGHPVWCPTEGIKAADKFYIVIEMDILAVMNDIERFCVYQV